MEYSEITLLRPTRPVHSPSDKAASNGSPKWDPENRMVSVNRTEALDASRMAVRDRKLILPRRLPIVEEFAQHMSADATRRGRGDGSKKAPAPAGAAATYTCSMHPDVVADKPGTCPKCGMKLVPKK